MKTGNLFNAYCPLRKRVLHSARPLRDGDVMDYLCSYADISPCGKYRYRLTREWSKDAFGGNKSCVFVMLNPSTADGGNDDPTIRRCVEFAQKLGYGSLDVVNLFAYRATNPQQLLALNYLQNPIGDRNQEAIETVCNAQDTGIIIAAWGAHGGHIGQDETVLGWMQRPKLVHALGLTKYGMPRHPLYLKSDSKPFFYPTPRTEGEG